MDFKFDLKALFTEMFIADMGKSDDKEDKQVAKALKVFRKHNIDMFEALEIMTEISATCDELNEMED